MRIERGVSHYLAQLERHGLDDDTIRALVKSYLPIITQFDPSYIEEMQGIAEGAGLPFDGIVLLNARTEIVKLAQQPDLRQRLGAALDAGPDGCTGVVVLPEASTEGMLIHAQNWDWKAECAETAVILKIQRDDGPDILTFTEAGALARSGFNAAGIAITANYL